MGLAIPGAGVGARASLNLDDITVSVAAALSDVVELSRSWGVKVNLATAECELNRDWDYVVDIVSLAGAC